MANQTQHSENHSKNDSKNIIGKNTKEEKFNAPKKDLDTDLDSDSKWNQKVGESNDKGFKNVGADSEMEESQDDQNIVEEDNLQEEGKSGRADKANDYNRRRAS